MQRPIFANEEIYHIYNRGVEKRTIFSNEKDYVRFIHCLFEFNDQMPALNINYNLSKQKYIEVGLRYIEKKPRKLLVDILAFCLMPNHFHILLRQRYEKGITIFMRKLGTGYTNYFNKKYERVGALFQGIFKAVLVKDEVHFTHIPTYIHFNPLDIMAPEWRKGEIIDREKALEFLKNYRWSSYRDYIGEKNFPSVTQREFILNAFGGTEGYKKVIEQWIAKASQNQEEIADIILE